MGHALLNSLSAAHCFLRSPELFVQVHATCQHCAKEKKSRSIALLFVYVVVCL